MKIFLIFISSIYLTSCTSSGIRNEDNKKGLAQAQTIKNVYVFIKSKPTNQYDYLGSIELKWYNNLTKLTEQSMQSALKNISSIISFSDNLDNAINEVKQKYPSADGVIFNDDMSNCEVIKFKN